MNIKYFLLDSGKVEEKTMNASKYNERAAIKTIMQRSTLCRLDGKDIKT